MDYSILGFIAGLVAVVSINQLIVQRNHDAWLARGIYGLPTSRTEKAGYLLAVIAAAFLGFIYYGAVGSAAAAMLMSVMVLSAFTDSRSGKAPKELAYAGILFMLALIAVSLLLGTDGLTMVSLLYPLTALVVVAALTVLVNLLVPNSLGMADVRLFVLLALFSYWASPIMLLLVVLVASVIQLFLRKALKPMVNSEGKKAHPYIPALAMSSFLGLALVPFI